MMRRLVTALILRVALAGCSGCVGLDTFLGGDLDDQGWLADRPSVGVEPPESPQELLDDNGCVVDEARHARALLTDPQDRVVYSLVSASLPDLDGDGAPETRWHWEEDCNPRGLCMSRLYLSGNGCSRYVGPLDGEAHPMPPAERPVADLWTWWSGGCLGREGTATRLRFVGGAYAVEESADCRCDGPRPALCERPASAAKDP